MQEKEIVCKNLPCKFNIKQKSRIWRSMAVLSREARVNESCSRPNLLAVSQLSPALACTVHQTKTTQANK